MFARNVPEIWEKLKAAPCVFVYRHNDTEEFQSIANIALNAHMPVLEVSVTMPDGLTWLQRLAMQWYGKGLVGAGSICTLTQAQKAIDHGAQFLVTPAMIPAIIKYAEPRKVPVMPSCLTPSELYMAQDMGCQVQKLQPASRIGGADYVRYITETMPFLHIIAGGRISAPEFADYRAAGATGVELTRYTLRELGWESLPQADVVEKLKSFLEELKGDPVRESGK
jgi:2-dehydro-3-deoxyphosphogluconate aldolase/(4S)-4-hydroxy-2-oxoglutarate aldolase